MDSIGEQGVRLERFYVSPLWTPTRASLLTGRYHLRTEVFGVSNRQEVMSPEDTSIGELFQKNGYKTGCFGKWLSGALYPETPNGLVRGVILILGGSETELSRSRTESKWRDS